MSEDKSYESMTLDQLEVELAVVKEQQEIAANAFDDVISRIEYTIKLKCVVGYQIFAINRSHEPEEKLLKDCQGFDEAIEFATKYLQDAGYTDFTRYGSRVGIVYFWTENAFGNFRQLKVRAVMKSDPSDVLKGIIDE